MRSKTAEAYFYQVMQLRCSNSELTEQDNGCMSHWHINVDLIQYGKHRTKIHLYTVESAALEQLLNIDSNYQNVR